MPYAVITLFLTLAASAANAQNILLECTRLVDTQSGRIMADQFVLVAGKRIEAVGDRSEVAARLESSPVEANYALDTCLPGLMDMHVHLRHEISPGFFLERFVRNEADHALQAAHNARKTLYAGFTTVRDMGDATYETVALRNAIRAGIAEGPRIYAVGAAIATTGGHGDQTSGYRRDLMGDPGPETGVVEGPLEARAAVRYRYKVGTDAIKVTATGGVLSLASSPENPQFTLEELVAVVTTASEYGMHVAAHAHGSEGMRRAVQAGVRSIEHGTFTTDEVLRLMHQNGTFMVPTLLAGDFVGRKAQVEGFFPDIVRPKAIAVGPQSNAAFRRAVEAGVRIAFGTDSGVSPHGENAREFTLMVANGMRPMAAIQAATTVAAELLGETGRLGRIAPGYAADIVAVRGNPLEDVSLLQDIGFVMKDGVVYKAE